MSNVQQAVLSSVRTLTGLIDVVESLENAIEQSKKEITRLTNENERLVAMEKHLNDAQRKVDIYKSKNDLLTDELAVLRSTNADSEESVG